MDEHDLDDVLGRAGAPERPSAQFEEELLLRLEAELVADDTVGAEDGPAAAGPSAPVLRLEPRETQPSPRSGHRGRVAAVAAVVVLALLAATALWPEDPTRDTGPLSAAEVGAIEAVCVANAADLAAMSEGILPGDDGGDVVRRSAPQVRRAVDGLIDTVPDRVAFDEINSQLAGIERRLGDAELLLAAGQTDQLRYSLPPLASELRQVMAALAVRGAVGCDPAS